MRFSQRILRAPQGELLVEAEVRVVCLDARTLRPKRLPDFLMVALPLERS
jgi:acyl-CoA thioesterase FadM